MNMKSAYEEFVESMLVEKETIVKETESSPPKDTKAASTSPPEINDSNSKIQK